MDKELKKELDRNNAKAKRQALKEAGLIKVEVFVSPQDIETVKSFDKSKLFWNKPKGGNMRIKKDWNILIYSIDILSVEWYYINVVKLKIGVKENGIKNSEL